MRTSKVGWCVEIAALTLLTAVAVGCIPATPPPSAPEPPATFGEVAHQYIAEATGKVFLKGEPADAEFRVRYDVAPDDSVVIQDLRGWIDDVDLPITIIGWPVASEPLRCTTAFLAEPVAATLESPTTIRIDEGDATVFVASHTSRKSNGECGGAVRSASGKNPASFTLVHAPENDHFALNATFTADYGEDSFPIAIQVNGDFVNRPPSAEIAFTDPTAIGPASGEKVGCPPDKAAANTPEGLLLALRSESTDPDGNVAWDEEGEPTDTDPKLHWPRADVRAETWMRTDGADVVFLGQERILEPELFAAEEEHWLALDVQDRSGAVDRRICRFNVVVDGEVAP